MKTEIVKVLSEKTVYIAEDGTKFDSERECYLYELAKREACISCYDEGFEKVTPDVCKYVDLPDENSASVFCRILEHYWISTDGISSTPGVYVSIDDDDGCCDCWINMTEAIARIRGGAEG